MRAAGSKTGSETGSKAGSVASSTSSTRGRPTWEAVDTSAFSTWASRPVRIEAEVTQEGTGGCRTVQKGTDIVPRDPQPPCGLEDTARTVRSLSERRVSPPWFVQRGDARTVDWDFYFSFNLGVKLV